MHASLCSPTECPYCLTDPYCRPTASLGSRDPGRPRHVPLPLPPHPLRWVLDLLLPAHVFGAPRTVLRTRYEESGTDAAYAPTRPGDAWLVVSPSHHTLVLPALCLRWYCMSGHGARRADPGCAAAAAALPLPRLLPPAHVCPRQRRQEPP
eukprot:1393829-Rhodomonas_salina.1